MAATVVASPSSIVLGEPREDGIRRHPCVRLVHRASNLAAVALAALLTLFMTAIVAGALSRHQFEQVITGSMVPVIPVGSLVVSEQVGVAALKVGDVILFHKPTNPSEVIVHRIAAISTASDGSVLVHTRGDANAAQDPWVITQGSHGLANRAVYVVPSLGTAVSVGRSVLVILLPALLVVLLLAWTRVRFLAIVRSEA